MCPDRVTAQPRPAAPDDVELQSAAHPLAALEQGFPSHGADELAARSQVQKPVGIRGQLGEVRCQDRQVDIAGQPGSFARKEPTNIAASMSSGDRAQQVMSVVSRPLAPDDP